MNKQTSIGGQNKESIISNIMKLSTKKPNVGIECLKKLAAEPNPLSTANANDPFLVRKTPKHKIRINNDQTNKQTNKQTITPIKINQHTGFPRKIFSSDKLVWSFGS
jgi:hypothetical protein